MECEAHPRRSGASPRRAAACAGSGGHGHILTSVRSSLRMVAPPVPYAPRRPPSTPGPPMKCGRAGSRCSPPLNLSRGAQGLGGGAHLRSGRARPSRLHRGHRLPASPPPCASSLARPARAVVRSPSAAVRLRCAALRSTSSRLPARCCSPFPARLAGAEFVSLHPRP